MRFPFLILLLIFASLPSQQAVWSQTRTGSEGTDFFVGILPIGNYASGGSGSIQNAASQTLLVSGFDSSVVKISHFDQTGSEVLDGTYTLGASGLAIPLNSYAMWPTGSGVAQFDAVHVTSSSPVSIQLYSDQNDNGELSLVLPTLGLGTTYVACAYNNAAEDPTQYQQRAWNALPGLGMAVVVAPYDSTIVTVRSSAILADGTIGKTVRLKRGQTTLIEADPSIAGDISGSQFRSNLPVAVFCGNNNAALPDLSHYTTRHPTDNFRNPVAEELIPKESWDSTGYVSIPFYTPFVNQVNTPSGAGDMFRVVTDGLLSTDLVSAGSTTNRQGGSLTQFDNVSSSVHLQNNSGLCSVLQYDYFSGYDIPAGVITYTVPSAANVIPITHWKKEYSWIAPMNSDYKHGQYANIICHRSEQSKLKITLNGLPYPLAPLVTYAIPLHPELTGFTITLDPGMYLMRDDSDFVVYSYGRTEDALKFGYGYAAPCGLSLASDAAAPLSIRVDTFCDSYVVHIHDTRKRLYRLNDIALYTDSVQAFRHGTLWTRNLAFAASLPPFTDTDIVVTLRAIDPSKPVEGYLYVRDGLHGQYIVHLKSDKAAAHFTRSAVALRVLQSLDSCVHFALVNPDTAAITITAASLKLGKEFHLDVAALALPRTIAGHDSLAFTLCAKTEDHDTTHYDTLLVDAGCTLQLPCAITGLLARINWDRDESADTLVCGAPDTVRIYLQNNSASHATEVIDAIEITGPDASEFSIAGNQFGYAPLANFPLGYGEKMWIDVAFTPDMSKPLPQRYATRLATLTAKNAIHSDPTVALTAVVTYGELSVSSPSFDFGVVPLLSPRTTQISVTNSGTADVTITKIDGIDQSFELTGIAVGDRIRAGQSVPVTVTATAQKESPDTARIAIWGDGICTPPAHLTFSVEGLGQKHNVRVAAGAVDIPSTFSCKHSIGAISIHNIGSDSLRIISAKIVGDNLHPDSALFGFSSGTRSVSVDSLLAPDSLYRFTINYHPDRDGAHASLLAYDWDSLGTVVTDYVSLAGTAHAALTSLAEARNGIDTSFATPLALPVTIPIYLVKDLPQAAVIANAEITASFDDDMFRLVSVVPAGKYASVKTDEYAIGGRHFIDFILTADTISASGKLCDVHLMPYLTAHDVTGFTVEDILCTAFNGDTVCTLDEIHPATIRILDECGDSILRAEMRNDPLHLFGVANDAKSLVADVRTPVMTDVTFEILDELGRTYHKERIELQGRVSPSITTADLPSGSYILRVSAGRTVRSARFVKQR